MRSVRNIQADFMREVASEFNDQRAAVARAVGLFEESNKHFEAANKNFQEAKRILVDLSSRQDRTHGLLVKEANDLGSEIRAIKSRMTAVEAILPDVQPTPAE